MEKYIIKRQILDAHSPELDRIKEFAIVESSLSSTKAICYSLNYIEAWEGDPYISYLLFKESGEEIILRKPEDV
jgi:hypothetical protein